MRDLQWCARLSAKPQVGREVWPTPTTSLFTDASMRGWGAVWNGTVPACGFFEAVKESSRINELELLAAPHGVRAFESFARGRQLQLVSDSRVTMHIVCNCTFAIAAAHVAVSDAPHTMRIALYHTLNASRPSAVTACSSATSSEGQMWLDTDT
jgi:hypothetical protein